jgi:hypothetical protein
VTGTSLSDTNLKADKVKETVSGEPVSDVKSDCFEFEFPAHSMTAIEIVRKK